MKDLISIVKLSNKHLNMIPTTEASAQVHLTSEPPKLTNQPVRAHASPRTAGPFESSNKGNRPLGHTPLKEATQVPKGIRFLSFGTVQTDLNNKVKEKLPMKKSGKNGACNQQRQDDLFVASSGSADSSNGFAVKNSCSITQMSSITAPGTVNHEVSEATKILEEFLFCGAT
ncbi:hypothetical protein KSP40_PGU002370 [Platanthera guangdongensis]|uniref:Uncharacterized protein n=1 Tax=Platanthera guangdongensis TaxID=2320717 RepID=A0ABR2LC42_9ASPA